MNRIARVRAIVTATAMFAAFGCGEPTGEGPAPENNPDERNKEFFELGYEKPGYDGGEIDFEAVARLKDANSGAAFRFYKELRGTDPNLIYSPLSFSRVFSSYAESNTAEAPAFEALFGLTEETSSADAWAGRGGAWDRG